MHDIYIHITHLSLDIILSYKISAIILILIHEIALFSALQRSHLIINLYTSENVFFSFYWVP